MEFIIQIILWLFVWWGICIYSKVKEVRDERREREEIDREHIEDIELNKSILSKYDAPDPSTATDDECLDFADKYRDDSFIIMVYYDYGRLIGYPIERKKRKYDNS